MLQRITSGSKWSTILLLVLLTAGIAIAALAVWPTATDPITIASTKPPAQAVHPASHLAAGSEAAAPTVRVEVAPTDATPPLIFAECIAQLCEMGLRIAELAQDDEIEAAKAMDHKVRQLLKELLAQFPDAGERSLAMLIEMADGPKANERPPRENTKLGILQLLLQSDLARRHELGTKVGDRSRIDALTQAVLDSMPICDITTQMGNRCLHRRPYLHITHEPTILLLLQLASEQQFPRKTATNMLLTLWDNLKATGERSSSELSQLALLLLDNRDPSQIVTACRQLLADPHYRSLVLAWLRDREDSDLAADIAQLAARELPVRDALDVLRQLTPLLQHTRGTYLGLGIRAPGVLADAYREHLAANNQPDVRRELVMGVGMLPDSVGLEIAELALANDPSPEVRIQAMYVFTVHANPEEAERAVTRLLDEPTIASSQRHLAAVVLALQNLEHGDPNTIARLGARLRNMSLSKPSRELLNEILARSLPGGGPTPGPGGG